MSPAVKIPVWIICGLSVAFTLIVIPLASGQGVDSESRAYELLIDNYENQLSFLKLIGGGVIGALVTAITFLFKALSRELKKSADIREDVVVKMASMHEEYCKEARALSTAIQNLRCGLPCVIEKSKRED